MDGWATYKVVLYKSSLLYFDIAIKSDIMASRFTFIMKAWAFILLFCCCGKLICVCVVQPRHDKTLGGWAGGTKGEQCQAHGSSAGVHSKRETVETTTGCLPGGGRETTQEGEGIGHGNARLCFHVWLIYSDQTGVIIWKGWYEVRMRGWEKKAEERWVQTWGRVKRGILGIKGGLFLLHHLSLHGSELLCPFWPFRWQSWSARATKPQWSNHRRPNWTKP